MEHQINQLIQKYHHKANSQGEARTKYTNSTEVIRAVLRRARPFDDSVGSPSGKKYGC